MSNKIFRTALSQAAPILLLHVPLGCVCGLVFQGAGYAWYVAPLYSLFVMAATMQFVALSVMAAGGSILLLILTLIPIGIRNVFYGLTMLERYQKINPFLRGYLAFGLIDGIYSLLQIGPKFDGKEDCRYITYLTLLAHISWVLATLFGSFIGYLIPVPQNLEFALTAFFAAAATEIFLQRKQKRVLGIAFSALAFALLVMPGQLLLGGILFAVAGCLLIPQKKGVVA